MVVDATDNFETRYLINDWALFAEVPWIYGGVIGTEGLCLPVVPRRTEDLARARGLYDRYVGS